MREAKKTSPTTIKGESLTRQADAHAADINNILALAVRNGGDLGPFLTRMQPVFADVSEIGDYLSALHVVREAEHAFNDLPATTRDAFGNDPLNLMVAAYTPEARPLFEKLGLIEPSSTSSTSTPAIALAAAPAPAAPAAAAGAASPPPEGSKR